MLHRAGRSAVDAVDHVRGARAACRSRRAGAGGAEAYRPRKLRARTAARRRMSVRRRPSAHQTKSPSGRVGATATHRKALGDQQPLVAVGQTQRAQRSATSREKERPLASAREQSGRLRRGRPSPDRPLMKLLARDPSGSRPYSVRNKINPGSGLRAPAKIGGPVPLCSARGARHATISFVTTESRQCRGQT